jgi:uncharacterized protein YdhG (YjbR/CyaY superfamily)
VTASSVEDYLAAVPEPSRSALEHVRAVVKEVAPDATETIAYQMPALRDAGGRLLVSYAAFKTHCSLFPMSGRVYEEHEEELRPYFSGKGTLRFTPEEPLPDDLIRRIVEIRIEDNAREDRTKKRRRRSRR